MTDKNNKIKKEEKVYKITWWPNFMLAIFGFFASLFGESSCDSVFYKYKSRLQEIEEAEVIELQRYLHEYRKKATYIIGMLGDRNASNVNDKNMTSRRKNNYVCMMAEIKEIINKAEAELDQRILKSRDCAESKVSAYLAGIHRGRLKGYHFPEELIGDDHARTSYMNTHMELNDKISEFLKGGA